MSAPAGWRPTRAFSLAVTGGLALLVVAALARRPELAVLAVPLLADAAWALRRVGLAAPTVALRADRNRAREGDHVDVDVAVDVDPAADLVLTAVETEPLLHAAFPLRPTVALPSVTPLVVPTRAAHWGVAPGAQAFVGVWAGHGLLRADPVLALGDELVVEPGAAGAPDLRPSTRTAVVGPRPSRRTGEGSELTGVREFVAGDRLRHVHWRVSARRGALHVTTTAADREAVLLLAVDTGSELGARGATTLDRSVRAAAVLARRQLHDGDRVGVVDLADPTRVLRPGTGRRHLDRVVDRLVRMRRRAPADLRRLPEIAARTAPGAQVVLFSPLLRPGLVAAVGRLARTGTAVTVVDALDPHVDRATLPAALRLQLLERDEVVDRLAEVGVRVLPCG